MKKYYFFLMALSFLFLSAIQSVSIAQHRLLEDKYIRSAIIPPPNYAEEGWGNLIAGVDLDEDGKVEIYAINANYVDRPGELIPKLYKFEFNGTTWDSVWAAALTTPQNTWPALTWGDLDKDGKPEIIWCPVNYLDSSIPGYVPNPERILVFELAQKGQDAMGIEDGFGGYLPNAKTAIVTENDFELRPFKAIVHDIDSDGTSEIIFSDRRGQATSYQFAVISVDKIPDNGDGSEVWTVETSGLSPATTLTLTSAKYDIAAIDNTIYLFDASSGAVIPIKYSNGSYMVMPSQLPSQNGYVSDAASWKSSQVVDLDKDGKKEVVFAEWQGQSNVWLMKEGPDSLLFYRIANLSGLGTPGVKWLDGGASGDLTGDGNLDFFYGSDPRHSAPVNSVYMVSYKGGEITDTNSYSVALIDSLGLYNGGQLDILSSGNLDGDEAFELAYSDGYSRNHAQDSAMAIIVLDKVFTPVSVRQSSSVTPEEFFLMQNYPNPFNPSTTIEFGIKEESPVELKVYDMLGREVITLIDGKVMTSGSYKASFDASRLSSGTYIYRLKTAENVLSRKMTLIK